MDQVAVYNPVLDESYLVPVSEAAAGKMEIRFREPGNGQTTGVNWHEDFFWTVGSKGYPISHYSSALPHPDMPLWGPADADGRPPRAYCQQGSTALATAAALDAEDLLTVASALRDRGDALMDAAVDAEVAAETGVDAGAVRRAAWYWAARLKAATRPSKLSNSKRR